MGRKMAKTQRNAMTVRITPAVHSLLVTLCEAEGVTVAAFTEAAIMAAILHPEQVVDLARLTTNTRRHAGGRPRKPGPNPGGE